MKRFNSNIETKEILRQEIDKYLEELKEKYYSIANSATKDGTINFSETKKLGTAIKDNLTKEEKDLALLVTFRPMAFAKMITLIENCPTEVAWYGLCDRNADNEIIIDDIVVYDQTVTGGTVDSTEEQQLKFFNEYPTEKQDRIHCQMHSHVNFACSPSCTDTEQQQDVAKNLMDDQYFLFMIWNKKLEHYAIMYDRGANLIYETEDIAVDICDEKESTSIWSEESMKKVEKKEIKKVASIPTTTTSSGYKSYKSEEEYEKEELAKYEAAYQSSYYGYGSYYDRL